VLEAQEEPSTHFTLFKFTKKTATPVGPVRGQDGWEARVEEGEGILRPCVYKRR
jgi:ribosomal RNA-processing protein 8